MAPAGGVELRRAYQALKSDNLTAATKLFEDAIKKDAKDAGAHAGIGFVRMKEQNFADAQSRFEERHLQLRPRTVSIAMR